MNKKNDIPEYSIKLLILYQGNDAKKLADNLIEPLSKELGGDIQCTPKTVGFQKDISNNYVKDRYIEMIEWADAAIAIICFDDRFASEAGNIWFEIGWWYAKKPEKSIAICLQEHEKVEVISNIKGIVIPTFNNLDDIIDIAKDLVREVGDKIYPRTDTNQDKYLNGKYSDYLKIRDTIGSYTWQPEDALYCQHLNKSVEHDLKTICKFRKSSTIFISELLRMGRVNRENIYIRQLLNEVVFYADLALETESIFFESQNNEMTIKNLRHQYRRRYLTIMVNKLSRLESIINELIQSRCKLYVVPAKDPWEKLKFFIQYRIKIVVENKDQFNINIMDHQLDKIYSNVETLVDWARNVLANDIEENNFYKYRRGEKKQSEDAAIKIEKFVTYMKDFIAILDTLNYEYFNNCRKKMNSCFNIDSNPFHDIINTLNYVTNELPQNTNEYILPHIWPDEKEGRVHARTK
jgi:hypothetical protein